MNNIKNAANYVKDSVKEANSGASKEVNKEVAKDPHVPVSDRARAAMNAVGDKMDQHQHSTTASVHKEAAKH